MSEDALGELYAWDSVIDDDFALAEGDPARDEDQALEAYEGIIYAASREDETADGVLSLAAMLLTKHFSRFPHVQLNVVNVLLELCGASRSQAVRIHSLRSLMQIVKPIATDEALPDIDNTIAWVKRIIEVVGGLGITETSSVILRQMTPLTETLKTTMQALQQRKQDAGNSKASNKRPVQLEATARRDVSAASESPRSGAVRKGREDKQGRSVEFERASKKTKRANDQTTSPASGRRENENTSNNSELDEDPKTTVEPLKLQRGRKGILSRLDIERSGTSTPTTTTSSKCPPSRFVFIGNIQSGTTGAEMAEYLSDALPDMKTPRVSIRSTNAGTHASMYAFVTMPSTQLARKTIEYVRATPFQGRGLSCSYARGQPVQTLTFVERCGDEKSPDYDVRPFDFENCKGDVWGGLMSQLERFGDFEVVQRGKVRFSVIDDAKDAVKTIFQILGREIIPVYDLDEQIPFEPAPRTRSERKEGFTLKSGRQVGIRDLGSGIPSEAGRDERPRGDERPRDDDRQRVDDRRRNDVDRRDGDHRRDDDRRRDGDGRRDDSRRGDLGRRDNLRAFNVDAPTSRPRVPSPPRIAGGNGRRQAKSPSRSPSTKPMRRDSTSRQRDDSPPSRQPFSGRRGRSPPHPRSPARERSPAFQQDSRAVGPRDNNQRRDSFASRSRSTGRNGRAAYDSSDKKRVDHASRSHSPVDARNKTSERRDRVSPPRQRDFGAPARMDGRSPLPDAPRRRQESFDRKDRVEIAPNHLSDDRGRPRERELLDRPRGPPQDMRDGRGMPGLRYGPVPSGPRENRGTRFSPPRHGAGPPRQDMGPPPDNFRDRGRYGPRDEAPPFRNYPIDDRQNGPPRRIDDRHWSRSRTRSRSPGLMSRYGSSFGDIRPPPLPEGRPQRADDRTEFRPRPMRFNGPDGGRDDQFDRQRPMQPPPQWNRRENGNDGRKMGRYGPANNGPPPLNSPPQPNGRRPFNEGPIRDRNPGNNHQSQRPNQPDFGPRDGRPSPPDFQQLRGRDNNRQPDFGPRERRHLPTLPDFQQPRDRDTNRGRLPESPRPNRQPEHRAFDTPPRQKSGPRDLSPPPSPLLSRDTSQQRKSDADRHEPREKRRPVENERNERKRDRDHHQSRERHASRHEKGRDERHREGKRNRHSERNEEEVASPVLAKRARSMTPSPVRRSPPKNDRSVNAGRGGDVAEETVTLRPIVTNDPFDDMDELTVDFEDDD